MPDVFTKALWDQRRGILGWAVGIAAIGVLYAAFYPLINTPSMQQAINSFPPGMLDAMGFTDMTTPAGYLGATTFGLLGPLLMIVFGTAWGSRAIAGEEESGRLDLVLAHPVSRWSVLLQRTLAGLAALTVAGLALCVALIVASRFADFSQLSIMDIAAASLQLVLLGALFGALALAVGAASGRRGLAIGVVAIVGVIAYFGNTLGPSLDLTAWLRDVSPFHYYSGGEPLRNGFQLIDALVLLVTSIALVVLGGLAFDRRDVAV